MEPDLTDAETMEAVRPPSRARRLVIAGVAALLTLALVVGAWPAGPITAPPAQAAQRTSVKVLTGAPASIDPARHGDLGSAQFVSQLYESLTAVDANLQIRPALAESWSVENDGTRVTFTLRDGLVFSDGTPLTAEDVVHSWRRLFDAANPSPLASLIADVAGARALLAGQTTDTSSLGVRADGDRTVVVDMERGGADLPTIVSSAPFAIVPPSAGKGEISPDPGNLVGSGAFTLKRVDADSWTLQANPRYWAGKPAVDAVKMITTLGGASPVDEFEAGSIDIAPISWMDAAWIRYDRQLGPTLRSHPSLSVAYYGFDTTRAPFDDVRVRQAFAAAVDWRRIAALDEPGSSVPATSLVPAGIPGAPEGDFLPPYNPEQARALLADAGYPGGAGFPVISFIASGGTYDQAIIAMAEENLGISIDYASMDFGSYQYRLATAPPQIWSLSWVADYPGPNDFLGVLLGTGSTANQGGWSNQAFDEAVSAATSASSPDDALAGFTTALGLVRDEAPVVPVTYGTSWALVRDGLLGAYDNGQGIIRYAGMAWEAGQ